MFTGIYVFVVQMRWIAVVRIRICRIMRIFRIGTMLAHRFHPHPSPLPSRERGFSRLCCLVSPSPLIPLPSRERGIGGWFGLLSPSPLIPLPSRERGIGGWFGLLSPSPLIPLPSREKGTGGWFGLLYAQSPHLRIADQGPQ